jgi:NarL family two-component system response regulator LiaR
VSKQIAVLIVDDHDVVRKGVRGFLEAQSDITIAGEAASGEEAIDLAADCKPDVILMDLVMPGMNGVEATKRVREASPDSQVVVLTSYHEDEHIFPAIKAGALSYLLKNVSPDELADAIRGAAEGKAILHSPVATRVMQEVRDQLGDNIHTSKEQTTQTLADPLSARETEVLGLIADGLTNSEIAQRLFISKGTVKRHINNIYSKLEVRHRTESVARARDLGLL